MSTLSHAVIGGAVGVHPFVHIGRLAMVGAMSRIDRDVPPYMLVEGNPAGAIAKPRGTETRRYGRPGRSVPNPQAFRIIYRSGLPLNQALEQLDLLLDNETYSTCASSCNCLQMEGRLFYLVCFKTGVRSRTSTQIWCVYYQYW